MERMQTTTTHRGILPANGATSARKETLMGSTTTQFESQCREFAREFPTPNVLRAVALCESGRLDWADVAALLQRSLGHALTEVGA